MKLIKRG